MIVVIATDRTAGSQGSGRQSGLSPLITTVRDDPFAALGTSRASDAALAYDSTDRPI
jgi:hypothetical protein